MKRLKGWSSKGFGENISEIIIARDKFNTKCLPKNFITNKMIINLNVLCMCMKSRVRSKSNGKQSSWSKEHNQESSAVVVAGNQYLASVEEQETVDCFLEDHEIEFEPKNTI